MKSMIKWKGRTPNWSMRVMDGCEIENIARQALPTSENAKAQSLCILAPRKDCYEPSRIGKLMMDRGPAPHCWPENQIAFIQQCPSAFHAQGAGNWRMRQSTLFRLGKGWNTSVLRARLDWWFEISERRSSVLWVRYWAAVVVSFWNGQSECASISRERLSLRLSKQFCNTMSSLGHKSNFAKKLQYWERLEEPVQSMEGALDGFGCEAALGNLTLPC